MKHHESVGQAHLDGMLLSADDCDVYRNLWNKPTSLFCILCERAVTQVKRKRYLSVREDDAPVAVQGGLEGEPSQTGVVLQGDASPLNNQCSAYITKDTQTASSFVRTICPNTTQETNEQRATNFPPTVISVRHC